MIAQKLMVLGYSPSLYWRLGEPSGTTINDASPNGNGGTAGAGVTLAQTGAYSQDASTSALFNNTATAIVTATAFKPFATNSQRTYMGWANRAAATDADAIFASSDGNTLLTILSASNSMTFRPRAVNVQWSSAWPGTGQWVHWALTYDDSALAAELFINGVSKGVLNPASGYGLSSSLVITLGSASSATWNGNMQDFAVFNRILSSGDINAIYNGTKAEGMPVMQKAGNGWTYVGGKTGGTATPIAQKTVSGWTKVKGH